MTSWLAALGLTQWFVLNEQTIKTADQRGDQERRGRWDKDVKQVKLSVEERGNHEGRPQLGQSAGRHVDECRSPEVRRTNGSDGCSGT